MVAELRSPAVRRISSSQGAGCSAMASPPLGWSSCGSPGQVREIVDGLVGCANFPEFGIRAALTCSPGAAQRLGTGRTGGRDPRRRGCDRPTHGVLRGVGLLGGADGRRDPEVRPGTPFAGWPGKSREARLLAVVVDPADMRMASA